MASEAGNKAAGGPGSKVAGELAVTVMAACTGPALAGRGEGTGEGIGDRFASFKRRLSVAEPTLARLNLRSGVSYAHEDGSVEYGLRVAER